MCGICGKLSNSPDKISEELIRKMTDVMGYRGPDDEGIFLSSKQEAQSSKVEVGLGHRRLSIIDLSEAFTEPVLKEDKIILVVFNGGI